MNPRRRRRIMLLMGLAAMVALGLGYLRRIGCDPLSGDTTVGGAEAPRE